MRNNDKCSTSGACNIEKDHIKGIKCEVKNCVYHDSDTHCTANMIAVGKCCGTDAACDTFKERK